MALIEQISSDIKEAMKAKEKERLNVLRSIKTELTLLQTKDPSVSITEAEEIKVLQKLKKQRLESAEVYKTQGRADLAEDELFQAEVLTKYLPEQLIGDQLVAAVQQIVEQVGAQGPQDMGKVMGVASKALAGKAAGKDISNVVKTLLNS